MEPSVYGECLENDQEPDLGTSPFVGPVAFGRLRHITTSAHSNFISSGDGGPYGWLLDPEEMSQAVLEFLAEIRH